MNGVMIVTIIVSIAFAQTPQWFQQLNPWTWNTVAHGTTYVGDEYKKGQTLLQVAACPQGDPPCTSMCTAGIEGSFKALYDNWTGAAADPGRKQLLLSCNGGHAGYFGNEAYALDLYTGKPRWYRLTDPTPFDPGVDDRYWSFTLYPPATTHIALTDNARFNDGPGGTPGRPHAHHSAGLPVFANGRIWTVMQSAVSTVGGGGMTAQTWAFNRDAHFAVYGNGTMPHRDTDIFPWETYNNAASVPNGVTSTSGFETGCYDPVDGKIWCVVCPNGSKFFSVKISGPSMGEIKVYNYSPWMYGVGFSVVIPEFRIIVVGAMVENWGQEIWVIDLARLDTAANQAQIDSCVSRHPTTPDIVWNDLYPVESNGHFAFRPPGQYLVSPVGYGVYHSPSQSILYYFNRSSEAGQTNASGRVFALKVPVVNGQYTPSAGWRWSEITPAGTPPPGCEQSYYSKFNMFPDFDGAGNSLLVAAGTPYGGTGAAEPVYVCKVPVTGLNAQLRPRVQSPLVSIHPNPFNPAAEIEYIIRQQGRVELAVYGLDGRLVKMIARAEMKPGVYKAVWDGTGMDGRKAASGFYVCRITTGNETVQKRLALVK